VKLSFARLIIPAAFLLFVVWVVIGTFDLRRVRCEVCIEYLGQTVCRTAQGATREEAIRVATSNACAQVAQGMTESLRCAETPPLSVSCDD
jgi:hypothetical protein